MSVLLASRSDAAAFAVEYFCREVRAAIGAFAAKAGGIDALVFSGGIGEHAPQIRQRIAHRWTFSDFPSTLKPPGQQQSDQRCRQQPVLRISANEEQVIRDLVAAALAGPSFP